MFDVLLKICIDTNTEKPIGYKKYIGVFGFGACGGDEENRTPVRKYCFTAFSERSLYFKFETLPPADRLQYFYLDEVPLKSPRIDYKVSRCWPLFRSRGKRTERG